MEKVKVWDPYVRIFHWLLVGAFAVNYVSEGEPEWLHVASGILIVSLIVFRIIWGFAGSRHALFRDFIYSPGRILGHLKEVATFRAGRYMGHDPAGGAMILALLLSLSLTASAGINIWASGEAGHHAGILPRSAIFTGIAMADEDKHEAKHDEKAGEELHEFFANLTLFLVILHICGVLAVSVQTRENLISAMITGWKKKV